MQVKTQKANGILALRRHGVKQLSTSALINVSVYPHQQTPPFPFFARPCPMRPRHGFVDSRLVKNVEEWEAVRSDVAASDEPDAEIVCMPFLKADWSGIITPAGITIGQGNDGATSGKGARTIAAAAPSSSEFAQAFCLILAIQDAGVKECPYVEAVCANGRVEAVQLRDGPTVTLGSEWVKKETVVAQVVEAGGDLLLWEATMKKLCGTEGLVIWHPGGCLSSHYAVQAIIHDIPVLCCDVKPEIGAVLKVTEGGPAKLEENDRKTLAKIVAWVLENATPSNHTENGIRLAIAGLHAQAQWGTERHLLALRAVAVTYMIRFSAAACLGELRHWTCHGPGRKSVGKNERITEVNFLSCDGERKQVFEYAFEKNLYVLADKLKTAIVDFGRTGWGGGYGGKKWKKCASVTANLCLALAKFLKQPTENNWIAVVSKWNQAVNQAHNTGFMLDKFIAKDEMGTLARVPLLGLSTKLVGDIVMRAESIGENVETARAAEQLLAARAAKGEVIKAKTKEAVTLMPWAGRFAVMNHGTFVQVHLQVMLEPAINRQYGIACDFSVPAIYAGELLGADKSSVSLTGSGSPYAPCEVSVTGTMLVLKFVSNGQMTEFIGDETTAGMTSQCSYIVAALTKWPAGASYDGGEKQ